MYFLIPVLCKDVQAAYIVKMSKFRDNRVIKNLEEVQKMKKGAVVIALTAALLSCAACAKQEPKETEKVPSSGTTQETEAVQEGGYKNSEIRRGST